MIGIMSTGLSIVGWLANDEHWTERCRCEPDGNFQERQLVGAPKKATASAIERLRLGNR
jgi:hypothetical protein